MTEEKFETNEIGTLIHLFINIALSIGIIVLIVTIFNDTWGCIVLIIAIVTGILFLILMFSWASNISNLIKLKKSNQI